MAEPDAPPPPASMEAILASIKRIIDEPGPSPFVAPTFERGLPATAAEDDVLELGPLPPLAAATIAIAPPIPPALSAADEPTLVSPQARDASIRAMASLAGITLDPLAPANTLDGLVRELLRPMLKEWLDAHLPELVERVVTREIARLGA